MVNAGGLRLEEIVARFGGTVLGDATLAVSQVGTLLSAGCGQIAFLSNPKYRSQLQQTKASAVILPPQFAAETTLPRIVHANSYACYARVAALFNPAPQRPLGVHPSAIVHSPVPASASVGEHVVVGADVSIGENVVLYPGCVIGDRVVLGDDARVYPNAVVYHDCRIGRRAIIHSGAVIGADGFGFAKDGEQWLKIPQIGRVILGDDVEVGANTSIDRGSLDDTVIADGVKLDNQIQVGHNCSIGAHAAMAGCVGIAGSTRIGRRCTVGGAGMISGHLEIADDVHISGGTLVAKNLVKPGQYTGVFPLTAHSEWLHNAPYVRRLAKLAERLEQLENKIKRMEKTS